MGQQGHFFPLGDSYTLFDIFFVFTDLVGINYSPENTVCLVKELLLANGGERGLCYPMKLFPSSLHFTFLGGKKVQLIIRLRR